MTKRVLIVDDHPPTVKMIRRALEREGMEVAEASNGAECLLAMEEARPDLVILDVTMPVMDGFQTLRVLREKRDTRYLSVIMLTCRREDHDVIRGWMTGADLYLTKPFEVEELVTAVKRVLEAEATPPAGD